MFRSKSSIVFILAVAVAFLATSGKLNAQVRCAPHATGSDVEFHRCHLQVQTWISFNAHEAYAGRPAKGEIHHRDANGNWFDGDITCVTVEGNEAIFSGHVDSSSRGDWLDKYFHVAVYDGGTPGRNGDLIWISQMSEDDPGCITYPDFGPYPVEDGNLVVHPCSQEKVAVDQPQASELKAGPNPFNAITLLSYYLPEAGDVRLEVFNLAGQKIETLVQGWQSAGEHKVQWSANNLISGVYFARLSTAEASVIQKVTLLK